MVEARDLIAASCLLVTTLSSSSYWGMCKAFWTNKPRLSGNGMNSCSWGLKAGWEFHIWSKHSTFGTGLKWSSFWDTGDEVSVPGPCSILTWQLFGTIDFHKEVWTGLGSHHSERHKRRNLEVALFSRGRRGWADSREGFKLKRRCLRNSLTGPRSRKLKKMMELKGATVFQINLIDSFQCCVRHSRGPACSLASNVFHSWQEMPDVCMAHYRRC